MYNKPSQKVEKRRTKVEDGDAKKGIAQIGAGLSATMGGHSAQETPVHEPDDTEDPQLSIWVAVFTLGASTAFVAICAEFMVNSIDALTQQGGISKTFVGLILLPIVGNAAEHATAVTVACKDKMDLAIGVAVGSSMQIALLVIPFVVVLGWILGNDQMTLFFDGFQIAILFVAVLLGQSHLVVQHIGCTPANAFDSQLSHPGRKVALVGVPSEMKLYVLLTGHLGSKVYFYKLST